MNKELFLRAFRLKPDQIKRIESIASWQPEMRRLVEIIQFEFDIIDFMLEEKDPRIPIFDEDGQDLKNYIEYRNKKLAEKRVEYNEAYFKEHGHYPPTA